jgi:hypothetical protein
MLSSQHRREVALVEDLVDRTFYAEQNAAVLTPGETPAEHFCRVGWRELRKPRRDFDVWWYWANHLDPADDSLNPLVHYATEGRAAGLPTRPSPQLSRTVGRRAGAAPRRAILFAAFDADGVVDDALVHYVEELARHGDVFVLYDNDVAPGELARLDATTAGAWAERHGAYDFGSYSRLARDLIGWDRLREYDEVVFANDSCYLVRPLDEVFATMDQRGCAWWGLQATKGLISTRDAASNAFTAPVPMDQVRAESLRAFEDDAVYDFHIGSYFFAVRRPVLDDPVFRRLLDSVAVEHSKLLLVQKYEIGLSHLLLGRGHLVDTFVPDLLPLHPVYGESAFDLIGEGFPLLKRFLITENHYDVPGLARWRERLLAVAPEAPIDLVAASLDRLAPDDRLQRNAAIVRTPDGTVEVPKVLRGPAYRRRDERTAKRPDVWVFAVDARTHELPANSRAVFEAVKHDPTITKVLLTRARRLEPDGKNVVVEPLLSPAGRDHLLEAGRVFVADRPRATLVAPVSAESQVIVAVRDGLFWERTGRAALDRSTSAAPGQPKAHPEPEASISGLLTASDVDALAAVSCTWPATYSHAWRTGLPAHDFLFCADEELPADLLRQVADVRHLLAGRRLALMTTARPRPGRAPYEFSAAERDRLAAWCAEQDVVLGLREADGDLVRHYRRQLGDLALDLSRRRVSSVHALLRVADAVLTDYSPVALDFAVTGRPTLAFVPDLAIARGSLLYDVDHFFPGAVAHSFDELEASLAVLLDSAPTPRQSRVRELLVDYHDSSNTSRVLARLNEIEEVTP